MSSGVARVFSQGGKLVEQRPLATVRGPNQKQIEK